MSAVALEVAVQGAMLEIPRNPILPTPKNENKNKNPQQNSVKVNSKAIKVWFFQFCQVGGLATIHNINEPNLARCQARK
jgi:hypothetical protein